MMTVDSLFLLKATVLSVYLLLKPISRKPLTSPQCRRQSKRSQGAIAERGRARKYTKRLRIKIDNFQLQIMRYFKKFVFMSEKRPGSVY